MKAVKWREGELSWTEKKCKNASFHSVWAGIFSKPLLEIIKMSTDSAYILKESRHIFSFLFKIFKKCLEIFVRDSLEIFLFFSIVQRTIWHYAGKMDTLAPLWSLLSTFRGLGQKMELGLIKSFLLAKPYAQISYLTRSFFLLCRYY